MRRDHFVLSTKTPITEPSHYDVQENLASSVTAGAFSTDGRYVAVCSPGKMFIVDVKNRRLLKHQLDFGGKSLRFSPDNQLLACGGTDGVMSLISTEDFTVKRQVRMDERLVDCVDFSPDSRFVAGVGYDRRVKIYDRKTKKLRSFEEKTSGFPCLIRYSPDGKRLLTGGLDGLLRLWTVDQGEEILRWKIRENGWPSGEFSQDGSWLVVGGLETAQVLHATDQISLRGLSFSELKSRACLNLQEVPFP